MSDLISREALIEKIKKRIQHMIPSHDGSHPVTAEGLINFIESQPTIEAKKVVRGEWVSLTDCSNAGVYCSVCQKKVWKEDYAWCNRKNKLRSNFCPNCGADMRKKV